MRLKSLISLTVLAVSEATGLITATRLTAANVVTHIRPSGDIKAVPHRPDVHLAPIAESQMPTGPDGRLLVTPEQALRAAESEFDLSGSQVDPSVGVVRARVSLHGKFSHVGAWIVTANWTLRGFTPATKNLLFRKLCIVVDARTGHFDFAYPADPEQVG